MERGSCHPSQQTMNAQRYGIDLLIIYSYRSKFDSYKKYPQVSRSQTNDVKIPTIFITFKRQKQFEAITKANRGTISVQLLKLASTPTVENIALPNIFFDISNVPNSIFRTTVFHIFRSCISALISIIFHQKSISGICILRINIVFSIILKNVDSFSLVALTSKTEDVFRWVQQFILV